MDNELYLKRFFIEVYNDEKMYFEYIKGQINLEEGIYLKWLKDTKLRNSIFSSTIKQFERLNSKDIIVESKLSEDLSLSSNFRNQSESKVVEFEKFKIEEKTLGISNKHYICNGYFKDTLEQIYDVLENGYFTVGICASKKSQLFEDAVEHYEQLRDFLSEYGYKTSALEINNRCKSKSYLLMYNHKRKRR